MVLHYFTVVLQYFYFFILQGAFTLHVKSVHHDVVLHESKETFKVIDYWIAAIGDSFASGEGNPDMTVRESRLNSAYWISEECHRSKRSFPFKVKATLLLQ